MTNQEIIAELRQVQTAYGTLMADNACHHVALAKLINEAISLNHSMEQLGAKCDDNRKVLARLLAILEAKQDGDAGEEWKGDGSA
jgi:hypothetical protein